ncbi:glycosyl hydrolase-like protein, putative [Trypanosoma cruzi marinkellei]|uniref:Glycosyl hydrolase-like protein, putative n=1 Tax=Trypanosoma cruzi marinkellei TaxID=85056 RepID=K2N3B0_TRYCR|nr:glycosyl hydrolase-like protein, putative [Trypanosoma cruzi marinkellei]
MRRHGAIFRRGARRRFRWTLRVFIFASFLLTLIILLNGSFFTWPHYFYYFTGKGAAKVGSSSSSSSPPPAAAAVLRVDGRGGQRVWRPTHVAPHVPSNIPTADDNAPQEGLLWPRQRHDVDVLYSTQTCKLMADGPNGAHEGDVLMRVRFYRPNCRKGVHGGEEGKMRKRPCDDSAHPIIGLMPHQSAASFFPEEVLMDEVNLQVGPSTLQSVVEKEKEGREEKGMRWRVSSRASPSLRCRLRDRGDTEGKSRLIWDSGEFFVGISLRMTATQDDLSGGLDANFSFSPEYKMLFFGLPTSNASGLRLPDDAEYRLFNQFHLNQTLLSGTRMHGSVPLLYAIGRAPSRYGNKSLSGQRRCAMGILWLNGSPLQVRTAVGDVGGETTLSFRSTAGATRVYLLPGPTAEDVLLQYYTLTGFPMMPPLFALGYHHTHRGYGKMDEVLNVSAAFLQAEIPVDTLGMGSHYMNGKRIFTWNRTRFSDPVRLQDELWRHGGRFMVLSTVPYVRVDPRFSIYIEGKRHEYFVTTQAESDEIFIGYSKSGTNVWIDFLDSRARRWYGGLMKYKRFLGSTNHTFFSLEENEPFLRGGMQGTLPMEVGHRGAVPHGVIHNMYGMLHAMAAYGGELRRTQFYRRPFLITQSYFAGTQRHAAVRLGYNVASWEHLRSSIELCLAHSIAGISFVGADVGGFYFQKVEDELLVRWYQLAVFYPLFRTDANEDAPFREVWHLLPHVRARIRDAVHFRYALLPYLYTLFWKAHLDGELIIRPLFFVYPQDALSYVEPRMLGQWFFLGPHLFVAPVLTSVETGDALHTVQIPQEDLYNFWSGEFVAAGTTLRFSKNISYSHLPEEEITPLFQRVGTILPTFTNTSGMRSTHDAANYTLTVTLPRLEPFFSEGSGGKGGKSGESGISNQILAQGDLFVDDGSRHINYHGRNTTHHAFCALALECVLFPRKGDLVLRWRAITNSSCCDVLHVVRSSMTSVTDGESFLLNRLRFMFATPKEKEHVTRVESLVDGQRLTFAPSGSKPSLLEVSGVALPLLAENCHGNDDDSRGSSQPTVEVHLKLNVSYGSWL